MTDEKGVFEMIVEVLTRNPSGTCSITGKTGVEVWAIRAGGGEIQYVSTVRLPEVLRLLSGAGTDHGPQMGLEVSKGKPQSDR